MQKYLIAKQITQDQSDFNIWPDFGALMYLLITNGSKVAILVSF